MKKRILVFLSILLILSIPLSTAQAGIETKYPVEPVYPPLLERPPLQLQLDRLPKGTAGAFPTRDGDPFLVNFSAKTLPEASEGGIRKLVDQVLPALGWEGKPDQLVYKQEVFLPPANAGFIDQELKAGMEALTDRLGKKLGKLSEETQQAIREITNQYRDLSLVEQRLFIYEQHFKDLRIEYASVVARWQAGSGLKTISGRIFNQVELENEPKLDEGGSVEAAFSYIERTTKPLEVLKPGPELVIYPYLEHFRYAWKLAVVTPEGAYQLWLDAASGDVLELLPLFWSDSGKGLSFNPDPSVGTREISFNLDSPSGGNYSLVETGSLDVNNRGADGVTTADLTLAAGGATSANFNVNPINGTVVRCQTDAGYNSRFQEVNAYAVVANAVMLFELLGSQSFGSMTVDVNHNNPCGFGIDNSCSGGTYLAFGLGGATATCSASAARIFNGANDATVIAHELGHTLNGMQYSAGGGVLHGSLNEGIADFWGSTLYNTDTFGDWWGQNSAAPVQTGWVPRRAEALDVFPEHRSLGGAEIHADGQMVNWALWSSRSGLNNKGPLGTLLIDIQLMKAMNGAGVGVNSNINDQGVHGAFLNLLQQLASEFKDSTLLYEVLSGFARAGITLSERDAIIDIDDDWLANTSAAGPTFTIFTGRDFTFSGGSANSASVFNSDYEVEVANDAAFSVNRVSSGNQTNVAVSAQGVPQATWTLPAADWSTLRSGTRLYYRVTTRDHSGGSVRTSARPGQNYFDADQPPAYAVINATGEQTCTCSPAAGASSFERALALLILIPFGLAYYWRRRSR